MVCCNVLGVTVLSWLFIVLPVGTLTVTLEKYDPLVGAYVPLLVIFLVWVEIALTVTLDKASYPLSATIFCVVVDGFIVLTW